MVTKQYKAAQRIAAATPASRNRYADLLRAVAILAVVLGHWMMAAVWIDGAGNHTENALGLVPATQWLTWALQVMPLFFLVGGFSNAISLGRTDSGYAQWLRTRLRRLVTPTIPLIAVWGLLGLAGPTVGIDPTLARIGSQTALIPLWFLAVYVLMVAATPVSLAIWNRYGGKAVVALAAGALATDAVRAMSTIHVGFANYFFVWGAVYLLGHAWADGRFARPKISLALGIGAGIALVVMTVAGPYHVSMVGVPGVEFGNTAPPSAALLALGFTQIGLALAVQAPMRRLLARPTAWTLTVLINGSIMTVYVWHMTAMALTIGVLLATGSPILGFVPDTAAWWITRPLWIGMLAIATIPFIALFQRLERPTPEGRTTHSAPAALLVALGICVSYASVAAKGMTSAHPVWAAAALLPLLPITLWLRAGRTDVRSQQELISS